MDYQNHVVIVTGGAQGIGRAITEAYLDAGALVTVVDADSEALDEWTESHAAQRHRVLPLVADVSDEAAVIRLTEATLQHWGRLHIVINNAGIMVPGTLGSRPTAEWDRVIAVNLRGPYLLAKYTYDALGRHDQPGVIINIASTRALMSEPHTEPYSASKGGLLALTHSLAVSLGPRVRVNAISPGWIDVSAWKKSAARQAEVLRPIDHQQHPVGRVGRPEDIAQACLWLTSPQAGFITGTNLVIDGGMTVKMIYAE